MSDTIRGLLIFLSAVVTIGLWMPLSNDAERAASGEIITHTYFGPLHYLTIRTVLKEPHYSFTHQWNYPRAAVTGGITAALWGFVIWKVRRGGAIAPLEDADRPDAEQL